MITYNHEKFIAQAIESVLMQEVNFDYELIIGEDCSTDSTREIIIAYQKKHPDKIRLLLHEKNLGGPIPGKRNFMQTLGAAQGQYITLLEGDDFWTSSHKLQKQSDFLDVHSDFAMCFHNATTVFDGEPEKSQLFYEGEQKAVFTIEDLIPRNIMVAASVMFRRGLFGEFPEWFHQVWTGDWALHILNAQYGKIGYLNEVMAAYRVHNNGVWSGRDMIPVTHDAITLFRHVDKHLGYKYHHAIMERIAYNYYELAYLYEQRGSIKRARRAAIKSFWLLPSRETAMRRHRLKLIVRLYNSNLYHSLDRLIRPHIKSFRTGK